MTLEFILVVTKNLKSALKVPLKGAPALSDAQALKFTKILKKCVELALGVKKV